MRRVLPALLVLCAATAGAAEGVAVPSPPVASPAGVVRVWGNAQAADLVGRWGAQFQRDNPGIRIEANLTGSDVGMAGLYTAKADVAILGRLATASEMQALEWVYRFKPSAVEIMTGSLDRAGRSPALVVFVHRENPLDSLSFAQLAILFGGDHRKAVPSVRTWDELGLGGSFKGKPIRLYGPAAESGTGKFFRQTVLGDSNRMNWEQLEEFVDQVVPGPHVDDSGREILAALAADREGLALANLNFARPEVEAIALQASADGRPIVASRASVRDRSYPLSRPVFAYYRRPAGGPWDLQVQRFLRHVLSQSGQAAIRNDDGYLPLLESLRRQQIARLED